MAVTKIRKISSWTLLICSIVSIIILGMFFAGGVVDPAAELQEPIYTGLLIDWTSALFFATIISTALFAIWQFLGLLKTNAKEALSSLAVLVLFVALLFVTYTVGDDTPLQGLNADSQQYNTAGWLKISDMWILSTITLVCAILACVVWGSIKKIMGK